MARPHGARMVWALALAPAIALIALLVWGFFALESATAPDPSASDTATDTPASLALEPTSDATSESAPPTAPATPPIELTITGGPADVVCWGDTYRFVAIGDAESDEQLVTVLSDP